MQSVLLWAAETGNISLQGKGGNIANDMDGQERTHHSCRPLALHLLLEVEGCKNCAIRHRGLPDAAAGAGCIQEPLIQRHVSHIPAKASTKRTVSAREQGRTGRAIKPRVAIKMQVQAACERCTDLGLVPTWSASWRSVNRRCTRV